MKSSALYLAVALFFFGSIGLGFDFNCEVKNNPAWYSCLQNSDCTFIEGACGNPVAIASKFKKTAGSFYACEAMRANCAHHETLSKAPGVTCISKTCQLLK